MSLSNIWNIDQSVTFFVIILNGSMDQISCKDVLFLALVIIMFRIAEQVG